MVWRCFADRTQLVRVAPKHQLGHLSGVAVQVPAIRHLHRSRHALGHTPRVFRRAVAGDDLGTGMRAQPPGKTSARAVGQQVNRPPGLEIHENRPVPLPAPPRPIVDAQHARRAHQQRLVARQQAQERVATHGHARPPQGASIRRTPYQCGLITLGEGATLACWHAATESPDRQAIPHLSVAAGQVTEHANVTAMDPRRGPPARWTSPFACRRHRLKHHYFPTMATCYTRNLSRLYTDRALLLALPS